MAATGKITPAIGKTIRAAKKRGLGGAAIADTVRERHHINLDRRSIDRWLAANPSAPPRKPPPPADKAEPAEAAAKPDPLDELEVLEERAHGLKKRIDSGFLRPAELAALNRELRQTFASIRTAKRVRADAKSEDTADIDWVVAKLRRHASQAAEPAPEARGVPEERRAQDG